MWEAAVPSYYDQVTRLRERYIAEAAALSQSGRLTMAVRTSWLP
ncbi:hypothetical protein [Kibdelosporangium phytohabitans]|nr:hypothetical protein [Kibdelosporangium phytohabitans]MBE1469582.1 hypothetical protein [Kibdelosporangium phytohabitans]